LGVQAGIGVHHSHDWRSCGQQTCMAGCAVSQLWGSYHPRTMILRDDGGAVGRPVIDHDRPCAGRHSLKDPAKSLGLIETRQYDVDLKGQRTGHAFDATVVRRHSAGANRFRLAYALRRGCPAM